MARFLTLVCTSLLAAKAFATPLVKPFEKLPGVPEGWNLVSPASASIGISLQIAVKQGDTQGFEQAVMDMSTPGHPKYGKHFKCHDEMKSMLLPRAESVYTVLDWLKTAGINEINTDTDWVTFKTTVGVANKLLGTQFSWFLSDDAKPKKILRTLEYSVPDDIAQHINLVQPTTRFAALRQNGVFGSRFEGHSSVVSKARKYRSSHYSTPGNFTVDCDKLITPQCLQQIYDINYKPNPKSGSKAAVASFLESYAQYADLAMFTENVFPDAIGQNFSVVQYNGGGNVQGASVQSGEANLDVQYMLALTLGLPVTEFSTGGRGQLIPDLDSKSHGGNYNEPYLEFLQNVLKMPQSQLPQVISISYMETEQSVPQSYAKTVCNMFAQLGSRGVSVIFASGDSGPGSGCQSNDGKKTTTYTPMFPPSCPWVTSVGSTRYLNETATFWSGGGFSNYWTRPLYQEAAVQPYLAKLGDTNKPYFNPKGRAFPDISLQGHGFIVADQNQIVGFEGTSCSAPAFGGMVALINDARLRAGMSSLGFLNPLIYDNPAAFRDVVLGGSTGCDGNASFHGDPNGSPVIPYAGWNATEGWDPVSGMGVPNFPKLLKVAGP